MKILPPTVPALGGLFRWMRRPLDNSLPDQHAERYRRAALSVGANVLSKSIALAVMALSIWLTIPYLGEERFGIWMTIASFAGLLTFLDLGIGNALVNKVATAAGNTESELRRVITGGLGFLSLLAVGVGLVLVVLVNYLPWSSLIKVRAPSLLPETERTVIVFAVLFGVSILSSGIARIFSGMQQAYVAHFVSAVGYAISLLAVIVAAQHRADPTVLLLATFGVQVSVPLVLIFVLLRRRLFVPGNILWDTHSEVGPLLRVGGLFFLLQVGTMVGWGSDSLLIASTLGAGQVASFALVQRLFQFVSQPLAMINAPLWGAYADAEAKRDTLFIRQTLIRSVWWSFLIGAVGSVSIAMMGDWLVAKWTGRLVHVDRLIFLAYAAWNTLDVTGNAFAMFLNGCGIVKPQVVVVLLFCAVALPAKFLLMLNAGLVGLIAGTIASYLLCVVGLYFFVFRHNIYAKCN